MDGTESGNIWQNSRKLRSILNTSPLLTPSVMHFSWNKQFQKCFGQGRCILLFFFHPSICPIWTKDDGLEGNHYEGDTLTLRVSSTFIWRCLGRTWATDRIGNGTVRGAGGGGLEEKGIAAKNKCWISCRFYFPKSERLQEGAGGGEGNDASSLRGEAGGGPPYTFWTVSTVWQYFMPELRWHSLHYLQFSDYVSVDQTSLFPPFHMWKLAFLSLLPFIFRGHFSEHYNDTFESDRWWLGVVFLMPHLRVFSLFNESCSVFLLCVSYPGNGIFFS